MNKTKNAPRLITPAHGRGRLLTGGKPGNKGGGRKPCAIRAACRENFAEGIQLAARIAKGEIIESQRQAPSHGDMIRALAVLGRYGFSEQETVMPDELVQALGQVLADHMPQDRLAQAVEALVKRLEECPDSN